MGRFARLHFWQRFGPHDKEAVHHAIDLVGMAPLATRPIAHLSGGQQQRAFVARAIARCGDTLDLSQESVSIDRHAMPSPRACDPATVVVHNPAALAAAVDSVAAQQALPPELVHSVIKSESNYNPNAVSPKGARGLMQLVPETARRFGVDDQSNPVQNLQGGARYLKYLLELYHGDPTLALAAYNAGEQAVARYGGVPPYPETQKYVSDILKLVGR